MERSVHELLPVFGCVRQCLVVRMVRAPSILFGLVPPLFQPLQEQLIGTSCFYSFLPPLRVRNSLLHIPAKYLHPGVCGSIRRSIAQCLCTLRYTALLYINDVQF